MLKRLKAGDNLVIISLTQALLPIALRRVNKLLRQGVGKLAGERYKHGKLNTCWGSQWGSIYLRDQKIPITVPRIETSLEMRKWS